MLRFILISVTNKQVCVLFFLLIEEHSVERIYPTATSDGGCVGWAEWGGLRREDLRISLISDYRVSYLVALKPWFDVQLLHAIGSNSCIGG